MTSTYPPLPPQKIDASKSVDTFIGEVVVDSHRCILVYLRNHGGKQYVRWRVFHKHRNRGVWYPDTRRSFVVPIDAAPTLGSMIAAATDGRAVTSKPQWLAAIDDYRFGTLSKLQDLGAPAIYVRREKRRRLRGWCLGPGKRVPLFAPEKNNRT